jgi:lycopene cyclase domain-containing protein
VSYWGLNAIFLAAVAVVAVVAAIRTRSPRLVPVLITVAALLITTAIFDNVMIGIGLVGYDAAKISGAFIGIAPLEDFAYAVAAAVLLPSVWVLIPAKRATDR